MCFRLIAIAFLLSSWTTAQSNKNLNVIESWKDLEFGFPSQQIRQNALDSGQWVRNTGTPIDVAVHYTRDGNRRIFTTIPRFSEGIPYTLATVSSESGPNGPIIYAYPNYESHSNTNGGCNRIVSAFRVAIDECNHMWVIDSGVIGSAQVCPPKILIYDLDSDRIIHRYQFTKDVYTPVASLLITIIVDIRDPPPSGRCQKAMAYIADVNFHGLVVYDSQQNKAWRVENKLMYPDPDWGTHTVAGESFDLMDGLFALNLTPRNNKGSGERYLYFHALASDAENSVPLRLLDNRTIWENNVNAMPDAFRTIGNRGVQAAMEAIDSNGNIFANTEDPLTIYAWNIYNSRFTYNQFKIVANNPDQLQFASGMKVVKNSNGQEELWLSTCRFQKIASGTLDPNEINFRIMACKISDLLSNRGCSPLAPSNQYNSLYNNLVFE